MSKGDNAYRNSRALRYALTIAVVLASLPLWLWWMRSQGPSAPADGPPRGVGPFSYYPSDSEGAGGVLIVFLIFVGAMWALSDVAADRYLDWYNGKHYTSSSTKR
jgi:hypothetical protein